MLLFFIIIARSYVCNENLLLVITKAYKMTNIYVCLFRGPVPVLVMSLLFIASVFMLHIWGKYTRS